MIPLESCRFLVASITSVGGLRSLTAGCLTALLVVACKGSLKPILRMSVLKKRAPGCSGVFRDDIL